MQRRPLSALYIQPAASFGGAERQAAQCIRRLPAHGVEVLPFVGPGRRIVEFLEDAGVRRHVFSPDLPDDPKMPRTGAGRALLVASYVRAFFRAHEAIEAQLRRTPVDVVVASRPFAWVAGGMAAAKLGVPALWRVGTHFEHPAQPAILSRYARRWPPRAIVCTSAAILGAVGRTIGAPAFVVHNGVDTARFSTRREVAPLSGELGIPAGAEVVGFVGRIAPEKGTRLLVEVASALAARAPSAHLLVAGDSGWRAAFEAALAARAPHARVHLLGFVREVERVYRTADVVISTSEAEGCPNAVLEAMAMGRAVVATDVGGTVEILRDGVDGVLCPPGAPARFADEVSRLLADPARRRRLGEAAARRVEERFSLDAQVARMAAAIRWAAAKREPLADDQSRRAPPARYAPAARREPESLAALGPDIAGGAG